MKKFFVGLVVLALSVVGLLGADSSRRSAAEAEQKFSSLPIGANLDGYIHSILVRIGLDGWDASVHESYPYHRNRDGTLESFAAQKLRGATTLVPEAGREASSIYWWTIDAITEGIGGLLPSYNGESKPTTIALARSDYENGFRFTLRNGKWEVPEEVFGKVRFQWGGLISYYIPHTWNLKVDLFSGNRVSRFAARERISDADNPCELPVILLGLNMGEVAIPPEVALAKSSWWGSAEITLLAEDGAFATFLIDRTERDGSAIRWSTPPPSFFTPPLPSITSFKRTNDMMEISVDGVGGVLEYSEDMTHWYEADAEVSLQSESRTVFRHRSSSAQGFYRLRLLEGVQ